jgi:hypothetical protein
MKKVVCIFIALFFVSVNATAETGIRVRTFFLEGVRSGKLHGPFPFASGTIVNLDTGSFRLDVLSSAGNFILTEERSGTVFGVYELVQGRMIDAGYQLFTVTRVSSLVLPPGIVTSTPPSNRRNQQHGSSSVRPQGHSYQAGIVVDMINQIAYNWTLDGEDGGSAKFMERRVATVSVTRGILSLTAGLIGDAQWNETVDDPGGRFQRGSLGGGTGWTAGMHILVPVFADDRWSASVGGSLQYQQESFQLEYGSWQSFSVAQPNIPDENAEAPEAPSDEPSFVTVERFVRESRNATLSETSLSLTARLDYAAPTWFAYAGLRTLPWTDTDLKANFEVEDQRLPLTFKRKDPISGFAGAGFTYQDVHCFAEFEAGGLNALRIGALITF